MTAPLLRVELDGRAVAQVAAGDPPCERDAHGRVAPGAELRFIDAAGTVHSHGFGELTGWAHLSVRVHAALGVQADCVVTADETFDPAGPPDAGIRFQPFFLAGAATDAGSLAGHGLFARGLHFAGSVTPGWVQLSGECDSCRRSFLFQSFHAGFSDVGYFYSGSGRYTLTVDAHVTGAPPALGKADPEALAALERRLPPAPDGSRFAYLNPFRCPHCSAPYIDFARHPDLRQGEYYGNYLVGMPPIRFDPLVRGA